MQELDQLTDHNSRMVGSWTDTSSHLRGELQRLAGLVKRFRLPVGSDAAPSAEAQGLEHVALRNPVAVLEVRDGSRHLDQPLVRSR